MRRDFIKDKKKLVVKIGTSSLTFPNGKLNFQRIEVLAKVLSALHKNGRKIILVSSGAIAVGAGRLGMIERPDELARKQALAAIGQAELIRIYQKFFDVYQQKVAQVLLTRDGVENPVRRRNANNTLNALLDMGIIPIINENDTVSTEEIEFGDNDTLSAIVATLVDADLLVLLSDIDGLYSSDPKRNLSAEIIHEVKDISREIEEMATGAGSNFGKGGMCTKIAAAKICIQSAIDMIIINGENPASLIDVLNGMEVGTLFKAKEVVKN
jgi:glutamate 5-kinase